MSLEQVASLSPRTPDRRRPRVPLEEIKPVDLSVLGEAIELKGAIAVGFSGENVSIRVEDTVRTLPGEDLSEYGAVAAHRQTPSVVAAYAEKRMFLDDRLMMASKNEYVRLPNGRIRSSRKEMEFGDGTKQVLDRNFGTNGQLLQEQALVDGRVRRMRDYTYDDSGRLILVREIDFDAQGQDIASITTKSEAEKVIRLIRRPGETMEHKQTIDAPTQRGLEVYLSPFHGVRSFDYSTGKIGDSLGNFPPGFDDPHPNMRRDLKRSTVDRSAS